MLFEVEEAVAEEEPGEEPVPDQVLPGQVAGPTAARSGNRSHPSYSASQIAVQDVVAL